MEYLNYPDGMIFLWHYLFGASFVKEDIKVANNGVNLSLSGSCEGEILREL